MTSSYHQSCPNFAFSVNSAKNRLIKKSPNSAQAISIIFLPLNSEIRGQRHQSLTKIMKCFIGCFNPFNKADEDNYFLFRRFTHPTFLLPMLFTQNDSTIKSDSFWSKLHMVTSAPMVIEIREVEDTLQFYQDQMPHGRRGTMQIDL